MTIEGMQSKQTVNLSKVKIIDPLVQRLVDVNELQHQIQAVFVAFLDNPNTPGRREQLLYLMDVYARHHGYLWDLIDYAYPNFRSKPKDDSNAT